MLSFQIVSSVAKGKHIALSFEDEVLDGDKIRSSEVRCEFGRGICVFSLIHVTPLLMKMV